MTLDELRAFLAIAESGSFTRASDRLGRSQPAVSRRIDQLEAELDTPLFERRGRRILLTEAGRVLLPHAESAVGAVRDGIDAVRECTAQRGDRLTLAVVGTIADAYLVEALRAFQSENDSVELDLQTANSREVASLVRQGDAAIGLRYATDGDSRLMAQLLGAERLYVVVPADHPVKATRVADLGPFSNDRWLGFPPAPGGPDSYAGLLETALAAGGIESPQVTTVDSLTAQKRLVEAGFGVSLMPRRNVSEELRAGSLRAIGVTALKVRIPIYMIRRRGSARRRSVRALADHLRRHIPALLDG